MATKRNDQWKDEDLDLIMALLEKDYTKEEPKKAPNFPPLYGEEPQEEEAPAAETAPESGEWEAPAPVEDKKEKAPKKKGKAGLVVILVLEIIVLLGLIAWWIQWLL